MSTQRYISTSLWDDAWIQTLDPSEKLLYLYFLTNPLTNIAGVYKTTMRRISYDTGFNTDTIGHIIGKFEKAGKAYYFQGEWIILPSWPKHQKWEIKPTIKKGIDSVLKEIPENVIEYLQKVKYQYSIVPCVYRPSYSDLDLDLDSDLDSDIDSDIDIDLDITGQSSEPVTVPAKPVSAVAPQSKPVDPLYQAIWQSFIGKTKTFTNYAKEGEATKRLVNMFKLRWPDAPAKEAKAVLERYYQLTRSGGSFWQKQPFTPSALSSAGIFDRVLLENQAVDHSANWVDDVLGAAP